VVIKLFGEEQDYHQAAKTVMSIEIRMWKLEGLQSVYYQSKIAEEINYKNNVKTGFTKFFREWNGT
jgi:antitoxin component YwqK of YwqJK toxin-antitoxin module